MLLFSLWHVLQAGCQAVGGTYRLVFLRYHLKMITGASMFVDAFSLCSSPTKSHFGKRQRIISKVNGQWQVLSDSNAWLHESFFMKIANFTDFLVDNIALDGEVDISAVLKIQTSSKSHFPWFLSSCFQYIPNIVPPGISWSRQADFGVLPTPSIDASILALGSRDGSVVLYR